MARIAPVLVGEKPADVAADAGGAGLDAAVILVDGLHGLDLALGRISKIGFDLGMQGGLVALERQEVIGLCVGDGLGDLGIGGDGVDGDQGGFDDQPLQDGQDGGALILFGLDRLLSQNELLAGSPGRDQMQRRNARAAVAAAAQALAVERDQVGRIAASDRSDRAQLAKQASNS